MDNLAFGLQLTLYGMGLVFGLLVLLWGMLALIARLDQPPVPPPAGADMALQAPVVGREGEPRLVISSRDGQVLPPDALAAISIAVLAHRESRRRQAAPLTRSYWPGSLLHASKWVTTGRSRQQQNWRRRR